MKIDYSKWVIIVNGNNGILLKNTETGRELWMGYFNLAMDEECGDDPVAFIKARCKRAIQQDSVNLQITLWENQKIPVEDNLDYIEKEAERRGLLNNQIADTGHEIIKWRLEEITEARNKFFKELEKQQQADDMDGLGLS